MKARKAEGLLRKVSGLILKHDLRPIFVSFQRLTHEDAEIIRISLDYTDSLISPKDFLDEISKVEGVLDVRVFTPEIEGLIWNVFSHPLQMVGARAVIFRKPIYEGLIKGIRERFGTGGGPSYIT